MQKPYAPKKTNLLMKTTTIEKSKAQHINSDNAAVKEIKKLHGAIIHAAKTSLDSAIRIGELLTKARAKVQHGEWESWAEKHLPFDVRTARNYLRVYEGRDRLKTETVSDLTTAYKFLSVSDAAPAPTGRFAELHGQVLRATDCIDEALPCLSQPDMAGETIVTEPEFQSFIRSQGIKLADGDLTALAIIGRGYITGLPVTGAAILDTLNHFRV
jgi:hypothetical protein